MLTALAKEKYDLQDKPPVPKALKEYILGTGGAVTLTRIEIKRYREWTAAHLPKKPLTLYRGFSYPDGPEDLMEMNNLFTGNGVGLSFSSSKPFALALAKERRDDMDGEWGYAVEVEVPREAIIFHHRLEPDLGSEHPNEKEVIVDIGMIDDFKIVKSFPPKE